MSRIGKLPVDLPKGVKLSYDKGRLNVEGPKGKLYCNIRPEVELELTDAQVTVSRKMDTKDGRSFHGLTRTLIFNMVTGVSAGFSKTLLITGVGYRAEVNKDILTLSLGYSQSIDYLIEEGIEINCESTNKVTISGIDKQRVGQVAAEIRSLRPPEPYKGKGIKYDNEIVRRKVGKSGVK